MSIVIGTDPTKAFNDISKIEREIRAMIKRNGGDVRPTASTVSRSKRNEVRYTGVIREKLAAAVELSTKAIASDIQAESPRWSFWFISNFEYVQGARPILGLTPDPSVLKKGQFKDFVNPILGNASPDGTKPQYIYNNVIYAREVAAGDFPGISAPLDWYLSIEQFHAGGNYIKDAIKLGGR